MHGGAGSAAPKGQQGRRGLVYGDGQRVLDKGAWKRWKHCQQCQQVVVERAKWKDCWEEIRFCSDRCKSESKRAKRQQQGQLGREAGQQQFEAAGGDKQQRQQQQPCQQACEG